MQSRGEGIGCSSESGRMVVEANDPPDTGSTHSMLSPSSPARLSIAFDDDRLVAHAGLLLPATLAERLGLRELVDRHLDLGDAPGRANAGDKVATLVASVLAGGDCIDDADALRAGGTERVLGCTVKAPSTLGTFLRSFRWGHVRQLDRVSRALLARAWAAGAGPGEAPFTIDLDSTVCETYGLAKEGAQRPGYSGARGYHPLLAVAAGTGDVLMARLRGGRAYSGRGAAHFLQETVGRVRDAGANGQLTVRADSGFYSPRGGRCLPRDGCPLLGHDPPASEAAEAHRGDSRTGVDAESRTGWRAAPMSQRRPTRRSHTRRTPSRCGSSSGACGRRLVRSSLSSRRIATTPSSPTATGRRSNWRPTIAATPRSRTRSADLKYGVGLNHLPSGRFAANGAWLAVQVIAHNLARWTARLGLGERIVTTRTLRRRLFALVGRLTRSARRFTLHLPARWPWAGHFTDALARLRALPLPT